MEDLLFSPYKLGLITIKNRIVMAPMTRSRAIGNIPNEMMAEYYSQRADAGLLITEGTSPSPNGLGYARIPGLFNQGQLNGWRKVTDAVHRKGGNIFIQLMHTGRVSHPLNMPVDAKIFAPSSVILKGETWTDQKQLQPFPVPQEMSNDDIQRTIKEFVQSAILAVEAGFDGVELHGANGYLIEQFINPLVNIRTDQYGGSTENRLRFVLEIAKKTAEAIGGERLGIRISPYGTSNGMAFYEGIDETYSILAEKLSRTGLVYIHMVDHSALGAPPVSPSVKEAIRRNFKGTLILSGGYDAIKAEQDLKEMKGDLIAFGRYFISNPSFVNKLKHGQELQEADQSTFYSPGVKGYTDYPLN
ncbi:MAG: alkene reductase [Ignavibacteriaceae bacterium]|nr:alkene reductase [Ignavibacteriaceae bacterium]